MSLNKILWHTYCLILTMKISYVNYLKQTLLTYVCLCGLFSQACLAQDFEAHENIISTVKSYINEALKSVVDKKILINPLNKNLKLIKCTQPLESFITPGVKLIGRTTVGVRCNGQKPWKIYVTTDINIFDNVVIADDYILRGGRVSAAQLRTEKRNVATLNRGYFTRPDDVIGKIAKTPINREQVITLNSLTSPKLVQRGKSVTIIAKSDTVTVKMNGYAMSDGHQGELIKVKNLRSQRIIEAEVVDDNLVRVSM